MNAFELRKSTKVQCCARLDLPWPAFPWRGNSWLDDQADARLYRKGDGQASRLCYMGHALMENRHGQAVGAEVTHATGTAERDAGLAPVRRQRRQRNGRITLGADKAYDVAGFVGACAPRRSRRTSPSMAMCGSPASRARRPLVAAPRAIPATP